MDTDFKTRVFEMVSIVALALLFLNSFFLKNQNSVQADLEETVLPSAGIVLPIKWGNLGQKLLGAGLIDMQKFEALYNQRGGLNEVGKQLLYLRSDEYLKITPQNADFLLNLFWALGLGTKNPILETGPMSQYDNIANFASTGGWTLAEGEAMDHYSRHPFIVLTPEQQQLVERVSKNIYRPCCNNPTHFPDCNHGIAMLGLLELMASQGVSEEQMYKAALQVNSYWFPDTYLTIANYLQSKGTSWDKANPREILGYNFSSASGYQKILAQAGPVQRRGASCGI